MRAHVIENGKVVNTIEVDSFDIIPNLIDADAVGGGIGDSWDGVKITPYAETPEAIAKAAEEGKATTLSRLKSELMEAVLLDDQPLILSLRQQINALENGVSDMTPQM